MPPRSSTGSSSVDSAGPAVRVRGVGSVDALASSAGPLLGDVVDMPACELFIAGLVGGATVLDLLALTEFGQGPLGAAHGVGGLLGRGHPHGVLVAALVGAWISRGRRGGLVFGLGLLADVNRRWLGVDHGRRIGLGRLLGRHGPVAFDR